MILNRLTYGIALLLLVVVYLAGMFVTLFENDSAQFAVMAMRMVQEHDYINLIKGTEEYLDKPHMHYWLAALSFELFGLEDWAYRIPGLLAIALGAYSTFGLGALLYRKEVGRIAALIFLSAQTIILSGIDLRTDAILTGFTALALWQLVAYTRTGQLRSLLLGAFAAGIAFSTKGQIALVVLGLPLLCHLWYEGKWNMLFDRRVLLALGVFGLAIAPMLYAYYHQFDLHPEKVIRGRADRSGILFIFWEQSFERLSGEGIGKNSSDYLFFFHTFLWVFLPWTVVGLSAYGQRFSKLWKQGFRRQGGGELLTLGGITLIFILISFAQFKLPHYLNITIPLFALISGALLFRLYEQGRSRLLDGLLGVQYFILGLVVVAGLLFCFWVFPGTRGSIVGVGLILAALALLLYLRKQHRMQRLVLAGLGSAILLNLVLNLHFYPSLLKYQGGSTMARLMQQEGIAGAPVYKISERHTWGFDFYRRDPLTIITPAEVPKLSGAYLYLDEAEYRQLQADGIEMQPRLQADQFRITRLQAKFLDPGRRPEVVNQVYLVYLP